MLIILKADSKESEFRSCPIFRDPKLFWVFYQQKSFFFLSLEVSQPNCLAFLTGARLGYGPFNVGLMNIEQ